MPLSQGEMRGISLRLTPPLKFILPIKKPGTGYGKVVIGAEISIPAQETEMGRFMPPETVSPGR